MDRVDETERGMGDTVSREAARGGDSSSNGAHWILSLHFKAASAFFYSFSTNYEPAPAQVQGDSLARDRVIGGGDKRE